MVTNMAAVIREFAIRGSAADVWQAVRDVGAVHVRFAPGFVTDCRLEGETRIITFGNGAVVRERIVSIDDIRRRLAYSAAGGRAEHHNASLEVLAEKGGITRIVWTTDVLPHNVADYVAAMMDQAIPIIRRTLEAGALWTKE